MESKITQTFPSFNYITEEIFLILRPQTQRTVKYENGTI
jgi:hypothetical protein